VLAGLVATAIGVVGAIAAAIRPRFFYVGDNPESFIPLWHHFGQNLLAGQWLPMEASGWMGGNYAGEAAYALWNPLLLLAYVVVGLTTDIAVGAAIVMVVMLAGLGAGTYLLARSYGADKLPSALAGLAIPFSGFTLFYEAAGWPAGLAAFVGVTWFWVSVRKVMTGGWPWISIWVAGYLAVTTGNPYALLGILVVLLGAFVELCVARRWRDAAHLVVSGALVGAVASLVFLPLLGVQPVTVRQELAGVHNDTFLVPDLGDIAGASTFSYLPSITNWGGALVESLPSTYLAWFALPLLPWVRWRALWARLKPSPSILVSGAVFALVILGPSNLWLFRWPLRLIEYAYLVVLVVLALALSAGLATSSRRARVIGTAAIAVAGTYLAVASTPTGWRMHGLALLITSALLVTCYAVWRRRGINAAILVALASTALVAVLHASLYPRGQSPIVLPDSAADVEASSAEYVGTVLQLANQGRVEAETTNRGEILFGNLNLLVPAEVINRYSGISNRAFSETLCIDYKGQTCEDAYERLWRSVPRMQGDLVDALRVNTLVVHRDSYPEVTAAGPPDGWREADASTSRVVWVREVPLEENGRVSGTSAGVEATSMHSGEMAEEVRVRATQAGWITFARLAWPGYEVAIDGEPAVANASSSGLLQVAVPPGEHTVQLSYSVPGLQAGWIATALAGLLALVQSLVLFLRNSRQAGANTSAAHERTVN